MQAVPCRSAAAGDLSDEAPPAAGPAAGGEAASTPTAPLALVLDTNVVLDWLLFGNPHAALIGRLIQHRAAHWWVTPSILGELEHMLSFQFATVDPARRAEVLTMAGRWAQLRAAPPPGPASGLRCSDPDDQKFLDLALDLPRACLLSRDKALLRLRRRAAERHGLTIVAPAHWSLPGAERARGPAP